LASGEYLLRPQLDGCPFQVSPHRLRVQLELSP
jgi:hypothetical protein